MSCGRSAAQTAVVVVGLVLTIACHQRKLVVLPNQDFLIWPPAPGDMSGAPGFEIVQSHFPDWKFAAADCTAAFGLHGALVVGTPVAVTDSNRAVLAAALPRFELKLSRGEFVIDRGTGANVLDSPALALVHLARLLATQPQNPPLAAG